MPRRGRISLTGEVRRDRIEEALFDLISARSGLAEVDLRMMQAIRRAAVVEPVLAPARTRLLDIAKRIDRSKEIMVDIWRDGQERSWEDEDGKDRQ